MKKLKYVFLITITALSFACVVFSSYRAFTVDGNIEIRLVQYIGAMYGGINETSLEYIQSIVPDYTIGFTVVFVLTLVIFIFAVIMLVLSLKKERTIQEWVSARKENKAKHEETRKAQRIAALEKELNELKKDGE